MSDASAAEPSPSPVIEAACSTSACSTDDDSRGIVVYVDNPAQGERAIELFAELVDPPSCCQLRIQVVDAVGPIPKVVQRVANQLAAHALPLTVVDGYPLLACRLPTPHELGRMTSQEPLDLIAASGGQFGFPA